MSESASQTTRRCVTLHGLPLTITLEWPFKPSSAGADFLVLHGDIRLEDRRGLHALVAVQMTQTVREVLSSPDIDKTESPVVNTLRKAVDNKDLEFLKSPKRLPVPLSSRAYDFKRHRWAFADADDAAIVEFLKRKVYWLSIAGEARIWLADPVDLDYLNTTDNRVLELARGIAGIRIEAEFARASEQLAAEGPAIEAAMREAADELEKKHAFERG